MCLHMGALTTCLSTGGPLHSNLNWELRAPPPPPPFPTTVTLLCCTPAPSTHTRLSTHPPPPSPCVLQLTWLLDDNGVPANWRALEGHSVNTYTMINSEGKERYIKLIWAPKGGG